MKGELTRYRIRGKALEWFESYLSKRKQFICGRGTKSEVVVLGYVYSRFDCNRSREFDFPSIRIRVRLRDLRSFSDSVASNRKRFGLYRRQLSTVLQGLVTHCGHTQFAALTLLQFMFYVLNYFMATC